MWFKKIKLASFAPFIHSQRLGQGGCNKGKIENQKITVVRAISTLVREFTAILLPDVVYS